MTEQARMLTGAELATISGAITSVLVISQGIRSVLGWPPKYVGLLVSLILAHYAMWASPDHSAGAWLAAMVSAFVIYSGATGAASMSASGIAVARRKRKSKQPAKTKIPIEETTIMSNRRFWGPWFKEG